MANLGLQLSELCGQLIVGGFEGVSPTARFSKALAEGRRGGAILFKRNLPDLATTVAVCGALRSASRADLPPFIGVDQEGGRVTRLPAPFLTLPPMRLLGEIGDLDLTRRAARAVAIELAALGFNLNFAPVLDVDSNPANPVIGDRSFSSDPGETSRMGVALMQGLQDAGVLACGKHFPGHGDTSVDSHFDLPIITHRRDRLEAVELPPFQAAAKAGIASFMTAHVVCEDLDPGVPATLSRSICTTLLRDEIGFDGVLFSDDLEMAAVAARYSVEDSAIGAISAGCDALLVCKSEDMQDRAHEALVRKAERDTVFRARCEEALGRCLRARRGSPPRVADGATIEAIVGSAASRAILEEIRTRHAARDAAATR